MKSLLLATALIAAPALAQTQSTNAAQPSSTPGARPSTDTNTTMSQDTATTDSTSAQTQSTAPTDTMSSPTSGNSGAMASSADTTSGGAMTAAGDDPKGGYMPSTPALSGQATAGAQVQVMPSMSPSQAFPPPAPLASYPICKKGQYDNCRQRGG
jgi:hypothetical protein